MVGLLRKAGLARHTEEDEMCRLPSFSYGYGESGGRIRNEMLSDFVNRIIEALRNHTLERSLVSGRSTCTIDSIYIKVISFL